MKAPSKPLPTIKVASPALLKQITQDYVRFDYQRQPVQMTYDLRRLRLNGLITRKPGTTCYELTPYGRNMSLFLSRLYQRVLRAGLSAAVEPPWKVDTPHPLRDKLNQVDVEITRMLKEAHMDH